MSAIPSWARVGAKVVFIADIRPKHMVGIVDYPRKDRIYTIREVVVIGDRVYLLLREIVNPVVRTVDGWYERAAEIDLFRPLITLEHDMATHFIRLLDVPEGVDA